MGLDVFLRKFVDCDAHVAYEKRQEEQHGKHWGESFAATGKKYEELTKDEEDAAYELYKSMNETWDRANPPTEREVEPESIEINSKVYPDHMFKIGYLRSSYNDGGINHVLSNTIGKDLYYVFFGGREEEPREYHTKPDWPACLVRAREVRDDFARDCAKGGGYAVMRVRYNGLRGFDDLVKDEKSALEMFRVELDKHRERLAKLEAEGKKPDSTWDSGHYSNIHGHFMLSKPMRVAGIILGTEENIIAVVRGERNTIAPATYVVYETDDAANGKRPHDWYQCALEIVVEMLEWVLAQPDIDRYRLSWSS
jgi:hypothetical protein